MAVSSFPSPYGDYGSYLLSKGNQRRKSRKQFPSPYGDYGSYQGKEDTNVICGDCVSVPLRGLWFLSTYTELDLEVFEEGFRPLTGIMVLIQKVDAR